MNMDRDSDRARMSSKTNGKKSATSGSDKLDISYLLNDITEERPDEVMRDGTPSRNGPTARVKSGSSSSRKHHMSSAPKASAHVPTVQKQRPGERQYKCSQCRHEFDSRKLLDEHVSHDHRPRSFLCQVCGTSFGEKGNLNKKEKPWACPQCGLMFAFRDTLTRHVRAVHDDIRPFPCTRCSARFKKRAHLQRHEQTCHYRNSARTNSSSKSTPQ